MMGNQQWNNVKKVLDSSNRSYSLGYILGTYLGDGWIDNPGDSKTFGVYAIDEDFIVHVSKAIGKLCGVSPKVYTRIRTTTIGGKSYTRAFFETRACYTALCDWLLEQTENKTVMPRWVYTEIEAVFKHGVVEGLLDSEGWVATYKRVDLKRPLYRIGFACTNESVTRGLQKLLKFFSVRTTGPNTTVCKSGKTLWTIWLDKYDFVRSPLRFHIVRKEIRIKNFIKEYNIGPSETVCRNVQ